MTQGQASVLATHVLHELGLRRVWHDTVVRFGENTAKTSGEGGGAANVLGDDDIFFIDVGPVWDGHEADAGDSFVVGNDPEMAACAEAARWLWCEVHERWRRDRPSGRALYRFAARRAEDLGWRLNADVNGHRVCAVPRAIHEAGALAEFGLCPSAGLWVLAIQIEHPERPFGALFKDLLIADPG